MNERHNRTMILVKEHISNPENFFSTPITITADNELLESKNGEIMMETLVNTISRFTDKIILQLPDSALFSRLKKIILDLGCQLEESKGDIPEIMISIGNTLLTGKFNVCINSSGWVSYIAIDSKVKTLKNYLQNPIGAMGAVCFASAEVFKRILELNGCEKKWAKIHAKEMSFSFLDYTFTESNVDFSLDVDIGKILLVGTGAVGSGFLYSLAKFEDISGNIKVIDPDYIDKSNLNRCLTYFDNDIGKNKAKAVERYSTNKMTIRGENIKLNQLKKLRKEFPIIISTVDNNDARYEIQYDLPEIIFHGATGNSVAAVSVIKLLENACLCCIFESSKSYEEIISDEMGIPLSKVEDAIKKKLIFSEEHFEFMKDKLGVNVKKFEKFIGKPFEDVYKKEVCGTINLKTTSGEKSPSVPFVSFFSGLALTVEIIKYSMKELHQFPMISTPDFLQINMFSPSSYNIAERVKNPNCVLGCSKSNVQKVYSEKWGMVN